MRTVCPACGSQLKQGATTCSNCGLEATGIGIPEQRARIRPHYWILWIGGAAIAFVALMAVQTKMVVRSEATEEASQVKRELAIESSVSTRDGFEARCGAPKKIVSGASEDDSKDLDASTLTRAVTLIYPGNKTPGANAEMHIIFPNDGPPIFREHLHGAIYPYTSIKGLVEMGCVKPRAEP